MRRWGKGTLLAVFCGLPALGTVSAQDDPWLLEVGVLGGYHNNFFFRGSGQEQPTSALVTTYGTAEYERDTGRGDLTTAFRATGVFVLDIDDADYQEVGAGVAYKQGKAKFSLDLSRYLNRLFSESGLPVFFDEESLEAWVRYSITPRFWVRGRVELEDWDFDQLEDARDADVVKWDLTVRYAVSENAGLRLSYLSEDRDANGPRNNREGDGFSIAAEGQPREDMSLFFRIRVRDREYLDAPPGDRNFERQDDTTDFNFNIRWQVADKWGTRFEMMYRDGQSNRPDRNYDGLSASLGIFYSF